MNIDKLPKWAQAHIAQLEKRVTELEGLPDSTDDVVRDLPPPGHSDSEELSRGWDFNLYRLHNSYSGSAVEKYCSSSCYHGSGWTKTSAQQTRTLFSTERLAWQAARAEFIKWAAGVVAKCDKQIKESSDTPYAP